MNQFVTHFFELHCAEKFQNVLLDELLILLYMFKHKKTLYNTGFIDYRERMILRGVGGILVKSLTNQVNKSYVAQIRLSKTHQVLSLNAICLTIWNLVTLLRCSLLLMRTGVRYIRTLISA